MRLHVTGAAGFLGRELMTLAPAASADRVEIRDAASIRALFARVRPDAVIHTAYRQEGPEAWEVTVDGAENVARAAHAVGARLVHISTDVVFDGRKGSAYLEDDEPRPATDYGRAKAESERRVFEVHPSALVVRTSLLVGGPGHEPGKHERAVLEWSAQDRNPRSARISVAHRSLKTAASQPWRSPRSTSLPKKMAFYEDEIRCPTQVGDLAAALLELVELDVAGVLHAAGADALSRADLAELVAGRPAPRSLAPPDRPLDCTLDCTRARALLRTELRGAYDVFRSAEA